MNPAMPAYGATPMMPNMMPGVAQMPMMPPMPGMASFTNPYHSNKENPTMLICRNYSFNPMI